MFNLNEETIRKWKKEGEHWVPLSVSVKCPHCVSQVTFTLEKFQYNQHCACVSSVADCPSCGEQSIFWIIEPSQHRKTDNKECKATFMYPVPKIDRRPELEDMDDVPESVREDYKSAINVYNIREWNATAVCCRRVIEGLMQALLPSECQGKPLFEQLKELPQKRDLGEPIAKLADAIRQGGNWGAHVGSSVKPDEETTTVMLDFIEYLLEYLYSLPHRVTSLSHRIQESKRQPAE